MTFTVAVTNDGGLEDRGRAAIARYFQPLGTGSDLPSWSTGTSATWKPPVFNRESGDMLAIRAGIRRALDGKADFEIVTPGDSKVRRGGVLNWPEQLKPMLGAVDGFVVADDGVTDARWSVTRLRVAPTTSAIGLIPAVGSEGLQKSTSFTSSDPHTGLVVHVRATGGATVTVTVDGTPQNATLPASPSVQQVTVTGKPDTTHTITIASSSDTFEPLGLTLTYPSPRLLISNPARSSTNAADWAPGSARWTSVIDGPATDPDLFICGLGTNSSTDLAAIETFYDGVAALNVPTIILSPGGLGSVDRTRANVEPMMGKLYALAQEHDWALIDLEQVIGQYSDALAHALMSDTVHENTRGLLLEALAIFALLVGSLV